jgi:hypothetical protein
VFEAVAEADGTADVTAVGRDGDGHVALLMDGGGDEIAEGDVVTDARKNTPGLANGFDTAVQGFIAGTDVNEKDVVQIGLVEGFHQAAEGEGVEICQKPGGYHGYFFRET